MPVISEDGRWEIPVSADLITFRSCDPYCQVCGVKVEVRYMGVHEQWHDNVLAGLLR